MTGHEAIWYVILYDEQRGPLTEARVREYLREGTLAGSDLIWRPGFSDWRPISEIDYFRQPPKQTSMRALVPSRAPARSPPQFVDEGDKTNSPPAGEKWSVWKSANIGLVVSALTLALQIGTGRGFSLASYAHTASVATITALTSQILGVPLFFALIAVVRNLLYRRQSKSTASAIWGALSFVMLLVGIVVALVGYGKVFFSNTEMISGEAREIFIADGYRACAQKQRSLRQNIADAQIDKYCTCVSEKVADSTTYQQLGAELDGSALSDLKQKVEAAGYSCR